MIFFIKINNFESKQVIWVDSVAYLVTSRLQVSSKQNYPWLLQLPFKI